MNAPILRFVASVILAALSAVHVFGLSLVVTRDPNTYSTWVLARIPWDGLMRAVAAVPWSLAALFYLLATSSVWGLGPVPQRRWQCMAVLGALVSLLSLLLFRNVFANWIVTAPVVFTAVVTVLLLVWARWPTKLLND